MFTELPLLDRTAAAHDAGFSAVEFWWPFQDAVPGDREVDHRNPVALYVECRLADVVRSTWLRGRPVEVDQPRG
ncbi:hypothetical protein [Geodermatophilus chilensis]|jgi:hydroxypyruvate isomerase|uniref:hypothetical protein n=1 Tax=Geodermatophilus chilensis TaxID=2035835 RepID=UPI0018E4900E|nr:hypothetical protein [Geodermatophilus chilensis]